MPFERSLLAHQLDQERLARRQIEGVDDAEAERERQHHPGTHDAEANQRRERGRLDQRRGLGDQEQLALVGVDRSRRRP